MSTFGNDNPSFECEHMTKDDFNSRGKCEESVKINDDSYDNSEDSELTFEDKIYQGNIDQSEFRNDDIDQSEYNIYFNRKYCGKLH